MSAVLVGSKALLPRVHAVVDGRPPSRTWQSPTGWTETEPSAPDPSRPEFQRLPPGPPGAQPALLFAVHQAAAPDQPRAGHHRVHTVPPTHAAHRRSRALPDPEPWSATLAQALAETLQGRRPVGQLSRWVDERVLALVQSRVAARRPRGRAVGTRAGRPAVLRSVHLQHPARDVVEVSAHVQLEARSAALAFRLQGQTDRWLCTALDLGPAALADSWTD